jgi:hypothetical protein
MNETPSYQKPPQEEIEKIKLLPIEEQNVFIKEQVNLMNPEQKSEAISYAAYWRGELGRE